MSRRTASSALIIIACLPTFGACPVVRSDTLVTGPIPSSRPGDGTRNYAFLTSELNLKEYGYVEEEFFIQGGTKGHPYKTRLIVRRPVSAERFNGAVLVEWLNVTPGFDVDVDWLYAYEHILRAGFAWVGISAQRVGIHGPSGLRAWSPARYGDIDVTAGGKIVDDSLSFDIYTQAVRSLRSATGTRPLGALTARWTIATGHSQSANRLALYFNDVQPRAKLFDAFVIHGGGGPLRADVSVKTLKVFSETDVLRRGNDRSADSEVSRLWEVAGASHLDVHYWAMAGGLVRRDLGQTIDQAFPLKCEKTPFSRIPFRYVMHAAYERVLAWVRDGTAPPTAPRLLTSAGPAVIQRDARGNALGGIRLPPHAVPTARNTGENSGGPFCNLVGSYEPFDASTLGELYPTPEAYLTAFNVALDETVRAGYVLAVDAEAMRQEAVKRGSLR